MGSVQLVQAGRIMVVTLFALCTSAARADTIIPNGDFESGAFSPWVLTGSGAVATAGLFTPNIAPAGGTYMGYITTGRNELRTDLGLADLDGNGSPEREFSSLAIDVTLTGPGIVGVDLNFLTAETQAGGETDLLGVTLGAVDDPSLYKLLFAVTNGSYSGTATPLTASDFSTEFIVDEPFPVSTLADRSVFYGQTGFVHYEFALAAGNHTLTFFVADSHTDGEATAMLIDNLTVSPVPEPTTLPLVALGVLAALVYLRGRQRRPRSRDASHA